MPRVEYHQKVTFFKEKTTDVLVIRQNLYSLQSQGQDNSLKSGVKEIDILPIFRGVGRKEGFNVVNYPLMKLLTFGDHLSSFRFRTTTPHEKESRECHGVKISSILERSCIDA